MSADPEGQLSRRTVQGVAWSYGAFATSKLLTLVATAVLARLLTPEDFGLVGFATVAITYMTIAQDLGLAGALIYERDEPEKSAHLVFTVNILLGVALFLIGVLLAPLAAAFFADPAVTPLMRALSVTFLISPLGAVHQILLQRDLQFRRKMIPDVGTSLSKGLVSIGLAFAGFGAWALVWGQLAGTLVGVVLAWIVVSWRPHPSFDRALAKRLMGYGLPLLGVDVIYVATGNVDYLIVGRVLGATALGIYTLAYRLPELVVLGVVSVLSKSLFPAFSKARDSLAALQKGLRSSIRYVVIFTTPICVGLLVAARPLVLVTLGPDWTEVIPVLRVLAVFAWVRSLMSNDGDVYKAIGIPGFLAKITALRLALLIPALLFAAQFGLVAVALAHLATTIIDKTLRIFLISRRLEMKVSDIVSQFMPAVIAAVPLAAVALGMVTITANAIPIVQLTLTSLAGAFAYAVAIWLMERDSLRNIVSLMRAPRLGLEQAEGESPR